MVIKVKYLFGYKAMALWPFILVVGQASERTMNHERIHHKQQLEMGLIFFYLWYGIEYLIRLIQYKKHDKAYRNISFECEAYLNDFNSSYLKVRKRYSWTKYL